MFYTLLWLIILLFPSPSFAETSSSPQALYCGKDKFDTRKTEPEHQEAACLEKLSNLASRKENELSLKLSNGIYKTLKSSSCEADPDGCMNYFLVGYISSAKVYILHVAGYENAIFMLVDSVDGTELRIGDLPHFSPDGSSFIVIDNGDGDYGLAIGTLVNSRPKFIWTRAADATESWDFQSWVDDHQVALRVEGGVLCPKGKCGVILTQAGKNWALKVKTKK
jgi:hypothetical protein